MDGEQVTGDSDGYTEAVSSHEYLVLFKHCSILMYV
jgi:hypothetical protein